jgi:hypothetical protein
MSFSEREIGQLKRLVAPASAPSGTAKKLRSVRDEHLARTLDKLSRQRTQAVVAEALGVEERTLRRWIRSNQIGRSRYESVRAIAYRMLR